MLYARYVMTNGGAGNTSEFFGGAFVADIEKMYQGEYWTNRYVIAAASLAAAVTAASTLVEAERLVTTNGVLFTKFRVSDTDPATDIYQVTNSNLFGLASTGGSQLLPLFNVVRVDFSTQGGGRPSRKYLRGILTEGDIDFNALVGARVTAIQNNYVNQCLAVPQFVDVDQQSFSVGSVYPFVGMRQLRRGSKRKAVSSDPVPG
jgi:hypothetical protein